MPSSHPPTISSMRRARELWSRDGKRVFFTSFRVSVGDLYAKNIDGAEPETLLFSSLETKVPTSVSPDGKHLAFSRFEPKLNRDRIWLLPLAGKPEPRLLTP